MTQKEFIKKFEIICKKRGTIGIYLDDCEYSFLMSFDNLQEGEIENDFVSVVGFEDDDFYITFSETQFTAYEDELEHNSEDAWEMLWKQILEKLNEEDFELHNFKPGDAVYWNDPAINDYPEDEREELLKRRFVVFAVNGEIISISDTYSEAEVNANELNHIS